MDEKVALGLGLGLAAVIGLGFLLKSKEASAKDVAQPSKEPSADVPKGDYGSDSQPIQTGAVSNVGEHTLAVEAQEELRYLQGAIERQERLRAGLAVEGYGGTLSDNDLWGLLSQRLADVAATDPPPKTFMGDYWTSPKGVIYYWNSVRLEYAIHTCTPELMSTLNR